MLSSPGTSQTSRTCFANTAQWTTRQPLGDEVQEQYCTWWGALGWRFGISIALPLGAISKVGPARRDLRVLEDPVDLKMMGVSVGQAGLWQPVALLHRLR